MATAAVASNTVASTGTDLEADDSCVEETSYYYDDESTSLRKNNIWWWRMRTRCCYNGCCGDTVGLVASVGLLVLLLYYAEHRS